MVQVPDSNVHEPELLKLPPLPPSPQLTAPVGVDEVPELVSATVAVNVIVFPIVTEDGLGDTVVLEVRRFTVNAEVPELPECVVSPP